MSGYRIERCQGASCTTFAQIATPTSATYSDTGLTAATSYRYRIRASDAASNLSGYSTIVTRATQASGGTGTVIRVNAGGNSYTDAVGNLWAADTGYNTGNLTNWGTPTITGTTDPTLFWTEHWDGSAAPELQYAFTVPNGNYQVKLYFAENTFTSAGARNFSVQMEGATVFSNIDVYAQVGYRTALIKTATVAVADGQININFLHGTADAPLVNAIEITGLANDVQAPTVPTALSATAASSSQLNLSWTASTDNVSVTGYRIERCAGATCTTYAEIGTATTTTYNNTGLAASTTYRYRVRANDAAGNLSAYSSVANGTTSAATDTQAPTAPTGLTATAASGSQINLSWTASSDNVGVTGYRVERCQGASCSTFAQIAAPTTTTYSDTGLTTSTSYSYRVRATDAVGNLSGYSNTFSATTPDSQAPTAPTGLSAYAVSSTQVNLSWSASSDNVGVTGYRVERCQGTSCSTFAQIATPSATTYSDTGLAASASYSYRVRAVDAASNLSGYSNVASTTTAAPPTTPTGLSAIATSKSEIDLSWAPSSGGSGVAGYRLERCQGVGCGSFAQVAAPTSTITYDMGLTAATSYSYRVRAIDTAGNLSGYSSVLTVSTLSAGTGCD